MMKVINSRQPLICSYSISPHVRGGYGQATFTSVPNPFQNSLTAFQKDNNTQTAISSNMHLALH